MSDLPSRTPRTASGRAGRVLIAVAGAWLLGSGCVYYNGVYNAQREAKRGEARLRRDNDGEAEARFRQSAVHAETVLVRFPRSKWRPRALYLAGRGAALGNNCGTAAPYLAEFLALPGISAGDRDRARVALAACDYRGGRVVNARARLDSLVDVSDPETRRQARLWAARTALVQGDLEAMTRYLGASSAGALPWELIGASVAARDFDRGESLLVARAARGDYRDEASRFVRELAAAGRFEGARRIVQAYDAVRTRALGRSAMHLALGDELLRAGQDSVARIHLQEARTLAAGDTLMSRESAARLAYAGLLRSVSLREVDSVLARLDSAVWRTPYARRLNEQVLLLRFFALREDPTGAAAFLAGEVARDSLRSTRLAEGLWLQLAREMPAAPLAPYGWYAASVLRADSAEGWRRRVLLEHPATAVAARLRGEEYVDVPDYQQTRDLLKLRWSETIRVWGDSLRRMRAVTRTP